MLNFVDRLATLYPGNEDVKSIHARSYALASRKFKVHSIALKAIDCVLSKEPDNSIYLSEKKRVISEQKSSTGFETPFDFLFDAFEEQPVKMQKFPKHG